MTQQTYIIDRPLYRVVVFIEGDDVDIEIKLTAKGRKYAKGRAYAAHGHMPNDDEAIAEIMHARDNYYPEVTQ